MKIKDIPKTLLHAVRQNMGAGDSLNNSFDEKIEILSSKELIAKWSEWEIGDRHWGVKAVEYFKELFLKEMEEKLSQIPKHDLVIDGDYMIQDNDGDYFLVSDIKEFIRDME